MVSLLNPLVVLHSTVPQSMMPHTPPIPRVIEKTPDPGDGPRNGIYI